MLLVNVEWAVDASSEEVKGRVLQRRHCGREGLKELRKLSDLLGECLAGGRSMQRPQARLCPVHCKAIEKFSVTRVDKEKNRKQ